MYFNKNRIIELVLISFLWALLFVLPLVFSDFDLSNEKVYGLLIEQALIFVIFLINRFLLMPYLFFNKKKLAYFTSLLAVFIVFFSFIYLANIQKPLKPEIDKPNNKRPPIEHSGHRPPMHHDRPPHFIEARNHDMPKGLPVIPPFINMLILSILIIGFDSALNIAMRWYTSENKRERLKRENSEVKLMLLRNQVSPHFFMNMLNNIHALIDINPPKAQESIIHLSKLMSHILYDSDKPIVSLLSEFNFIKSYIALMRIRFSDKVSVNVNFDEKLNGIYIAPMLFLNFIENAFKYGVSYKNESYVNIDFALENNKLVFKVVNSNYAKDKKNNVGLGISNTKQRLELLYANAYTLQIKDTDTDYTVILILSL